MSPNFSNMYSEIILQDIEDRPEGIVVNGIKISNLRCTDDTVLIVMMMMEGLQKFFDAAVTSSEQLGL